MTIKTAQPCQRQQHLLAASRHGVHLARQNALHCPRAHDPAQSHRCSAGLDHSTAKSCSAGPETLQRMVVLRLARDGVFVRAGAAALAHVLRRVRVAERVEEHAVHEAFAAHAFGDARAERFILSAQFLRPQRPRRAPPRRTYVLASMRTGVLAVCAPAVLDCWPCN